jgi:hypothetical protein
MKTLAAALLVCAAAAAASAPLAAQVAAPQPGERVRLHLADGSQVDARLVHLTADSIIVRNWKGVERRYAVASLDQVWASSDSSTSALRGMAIGALAGGLGLGLMAAAEYEPCSAPPGSFGCVFASKSAFDDFKLAAKIGAVLGGLVGTIVGGNTFRREWRRIDGGAEPAAALMAAPRSDGSVMVRLTLRL